MPGVCVSGVCVPGVGVCLVWVVPLPISVAIGVAVKQLVQLVKGLQDCIQKIDKKGGGKLDFTK